MTDVLFRTLGIAVTVCRGGRERGPKGASEEALQGGREKTEEGGRELPPASSSPGILLLIPIRSGLLELGGYVISPLRRRLPLLYAIRVHQKVLLIGGGYRGTLIGTPRDS